MSACRRPFPIGPSAVGVGVFSRGERTNAKSNCPPYAEAERGEQGVVRGTASNRRCSWFTGGRQWRLVEAYAGTKTLEAFHDVLHRGSVIGGTSAGTSIQGSFLVRGDPKTKKTVVGKYTNGFGFLPQSAIDQHLLARNRERDLIKVIEERPELLGIGVDEGTAAIVHEDTLRVAGKSVVSICDARRWDTADSLTADQKYFFLHPGNTFNLRNRTVLSLQE